MGAWSVLDLTPVISPFVVLLLDALSGVPLKEATNPPLPAVHHPFVSRGFLVVSHAKPPFT